MAAVAADPGTKAPNFDIPAQEARDGLRLALSDYRGEFVVVLFYPIKQFARFRNFSERYSEFLQLNALVLGITNGDGAEGPGGNDLAFPLIHDLAGVIAQKYGMTADGADGGIAQGYFIIDTEGTVQHMSKSNVMSARAVDESLFILKNLQTVQRFGADQGLVLPSLASYPAAAQRRGSQHIRLRPSVPLEPVKQQLAALRGETVGVLLLNLGGPNTLDDVEPFLYNLFSDPEIIRLPGQMAWLNKPLAFVVAKLRARSSIEGYRAIGGGSPQLSTTIQQGQAIEAAIARQGLNARCYVAMRYWEPFTSTAITQMKADGITHLVVLPLYPQFSISTSGSSLRLLEQYLYEDRDFSKVVTTVIPAWYNREGYVRAMADEVAACCDRFSAPTHPVIFFSAHGVPKKYISELGDPYMEQMEACVRFIMDELKARGYNNEHVVAFQSRVGPLEWLRPYTDEKLREMGRQGVKELVVVPVSFVQEHIETLEEIDMEYRELAEECGIERWERVPALGLNQRFIDDLAAAVIEAMPQLIQPTGKAINEANPVSLRIVNELVSLYKKEQVRLVPQSKKLFGLTPDAEVVNGRIAMFGLAIVTLWAAVQGMALVLVQHPLA